MRKNVSTNIINNLNESYDMYNVVEDLIRDIRNLKDKLDNNEVKDLKEASRILGIILDQADENIQDAW